MLLNCARHPMPACKPCRMVEKMPSLSTYGQVLLLSWWVPAAKPPAGADASDSTSSRQPTTDFAGGLTPASALASAPLAGLRLGLVVETLGEGVEAGVDSAVRGAARHLESLGAVVEEVRSWEADQPERGGGKRGGSRRGCVHALCVRVCMGGPECRRLG